MKIHYFQRYKQMENVATANTMLLLKRFYEYSADKFFHFLKGNIFGDAFDPEMVFELQKTGKGLARVPDAMIAQPSFNILVETKAQKDTKQHDEFDMEQLCGHLEHFENEDMQVLMTLAPRPMSSNQKDEFKARLREFNEKHGKKIKHVNMTFMEVADGIREYLEDRDYDMIEVLDDYEEYLRYDGLVIGADAWKTMRMQLAGDTLDFNMQNNVYYDNAARGFRPHDYLGLYKNKSVRCIGKICTIVTAEDDNGQIDYEVESGELTEDRKNLIRMAADDAKIRGWDILNPKHRFFFVEEFIPTDFKKETSGPSMGSRIFDLTEVLKMDKLPETNEVAKLLESKTWR